MALQKNSSNSRLVSSGFLTNASFMLPKNVLHTHKSHSAVSQSVNASNCNTNPKYKYSNSVLLRLCN